jgi:polar amino acid transport system substrate-binding protein
MKIWHYLLFAVALPAAAAPPLTMCFEEVIHLPWSRPDATGLNFDLLERVSRQLDEHFVYMGKPWRRCIEELRTGSVDAVIGAADTTQRREFARVPALPDGSADPARAMFESNFYVYLRVGGKASWDGHTLSTPDHVVAVPPGYIISAILRQRGMQPQELARSAQDGLRLLVDGKFDAALLLGDEAGDIARQDARFRGKVVQAPIPYLPLSLYLMVGRNAYARDPARIDAIWQAIAKVRQTPEYRKLESASRSTP